MKELWEKARAGDKIAEEEIISILRERFLVISRYSIRNEDAKDVAHEACMAVLSGYKLVGIPFEYNAWAQKILKNKIADHFQKKAVEKKIMSGTDPSELETFHPGNTPDHETIITLERCLKKLRTAYPQYARALELIQYGYTTEEVCAEMRVSKNNLYVILNRGRSYLKTCLTSGEKSK